MSNFRSILILPTLLAMAMNALALPVKLIWDTDFMSDCDDPGALGMLHALADNGEVEVLATFSSGRFAYSPAAIDAVNTYYGRGHIPVATTKDPTAVSIAGSYAQHLAQNFPHDTPVDATVPDAVAAYRELLAGQEDHSVVIVTVGYATNLKNLLASGPDRFSPLDGTNLVAAKVVKWVNMGGNFEDYENNDTNVNWTRDKVSAVTAIRNWPTEVVFNGREIGHLMRAGARLSQTPDSNPVHAAYKQYFSGTAKDQHCADPSATLYAVRGLGPGARQYWTLDYGQIQIHDDATFVWSSGATGPRTESRMISARTWPDLGLMALDEVDEIVEDLMIQAPLGALPVAPSAPSNGAAATNATERGQVTLNWAPCTVAHSASWVAGYELRRNGTLVGKALGPRFVDTVPATGDYVYRIQAYTPSGVLGEALEVGIHVELSDEEPPPPPPPPQTLQGAPVQYTLDEHTLALYHFDETSGSITNAAPNPALNLTDTGGPTGRGNGGGGYGAAALPGFGKAFDVLKSGDGTYYANSSSGLSTKGGLLTAAAVPQSSLQGPDGAFTYEALVVFDSRTLEQEILAHDGPDGARGFMVRMTAAGKLGLYPGAPNIEIAVPTTGVHAYASDVWFHIAITYTGEANVADNLKFYWTRMDANAFPANLIGTGKLSNDLDLIATNSNGNKLGIGCTTRNTPFRFQPKCVDEIRISTIARAADDFIFGPPSKRTQIIIQ